MRFPSLEIIKKCRVLVVGDVMLDRYWHGEVARISPEAPVPVIHVQREEDRLGGAANVALNVRTIGGQVTLLSLVGQDDAAEKLLKLLFLQGIRSTLTKDPSMATIVKLRVIGRSQQMLRIDFEKQPDRKILTSLVREFAVHVTGHDIVIFSDYGKGGLAHVSEMISIAKSAGKIVLVDPKGTEWDRYRGSTILTPNRAELAQVVGQWSDEAQLAEFVKSLRQSLDVEALLLTRSEDGMTLFSTNGACSIPAQAREVADVTGAGDTVIATLALMIACGLNLEESMVWANRAGGLVVEKIGTASVTYDELQG
jgi:rfaE bifunctional protein kinase chain/domain